MIAQIISLLLAILQIEINGEPVKAELAITESQRRKGLMHRESLKEGEGMLFLFEREEILSFWMKNTQIPLSIGFFDASRTLINIETMKPNDISQVYLSKRPALYALEVPEGWFERRKIAPGMKFEWTESK